MKQLLTCNTIGLFTTDNTNMVDFYTEIMGFGIRYTSLGQKIQ